ncbi:ABC transporter permease [Oricola sp.]|uniref:ABC transporter permease n=1 Tax=Oricola sp. TaxID=1979950 RepID=UPI003BAD9F3B
MPEIRLEPRTGPSLAASFLVSATAVVLTAIAGSLLFMLYGKSPAAGFHAFFIEPLLSRYGIGEVLLKMGPLLLIAQGLAIGFRARLWNIGAEGQLLIGAILAGTIAIMFESSDSILLLPLMVLAGAAGGMAWASIAAYLKVRFHANEILVTFMLSSIALQLLYYLVTGPLKDPQGFNFPQSITFGDAAMFPVIMDGTRVNASLYLGLAATVIAWVLMQRTLAGYKLIVGGLAPGAARYAGFSANRTVWICLLIGGAAAGIAGVGEVAGPLGMLQRNISHGYGYAAIIVAFLGGLHPVGILISSALMALIYVGGDFARLSIGLPSAVTTIFQGMLLVFYLASSLLLTHRVRFGASRPRQTAGETANG